MSTVFLFAAGFGTRMGALTKDRPKPLIHVAGKPLIDHALDLTATLPDVTVAANLHYKADMLQAHLEPKGVTLFHEEPEILETGGGLKAALPALGPEPLFTMNTDAIWDGPNPLELLRKAWRPDVMDALLMCVPVDNAIGHTGSGDFSQDASGRITRGQGLVYGGVQILKTQRLAEIGQRAFSLNLLWDLLHADGRLYGFRYPGNWCDVGAPAGIELAEKMIGHV